MATMEGWDTGWAWGGWEGWEEWEGWEAWEEGGDQGSLVVQCR